MKIITVSWVRNESDILEAFVRHHAAFARRMVIVDHRSQDNSRELLEQLKREGLPLDIRHDDRLGHFQAQVLTEIVREVADRDDPDWIFPLDADEFLVTLNTRSIEKTLEDEGQDMMLSIPWRTYVPLPSDSAKEPHILRRITHRKATENPTWWKVILPRTVLRSTHGLTLAQGNHAAENGSGSPIPMQESTRLALAHFPVRSVGQLTRKVVAGWLSSRLDAKSGRGAYFQWKALYDELLAGKQFTQGDLTRLGLAYATTEQWKSLPVDFTGEQPEPRYVELPKMTKLTERVIQDPVPTDGVVRYPPREAGAWEVLLKSAEDLAEEYVKLARKQAARERGISAQSDGGRDSPENRRIPAAATQRLSDRLTEDNR
ncbi:MAG: glycosyltransferase family 2 protein [Candidatus Peribacteraceae bacterium]